MATALRTGTSRNSAAYELESRLTMFFRDLFYEDFTSWRLSQPPKESSCAVLAKPTTQIAFRKGPPWPGERALPSGDGRLRWADLFGTSAPA